MKNILIIILSLFIIMTLSSVIVIGFNSLVGLSTDVNNEDVATSIAAVAFAIGIVIKIIYDKKETQLK
ncbi:MAG: hypothetical protein WA945_01190 [Arcobacteraceae bacterium]